MTQSPVRPVTSSWALPRYLVAATLARVADAGAAVGIVLFAVSRMGPGGALVGGLLAAALTVPHICGAWLGRLVDRADDVRRPLAAGCAVYAAALALAVGLLAAGWPWPAGAALLVAGSCGPLLTGGLSSLAAGLGTAPDRAYSIDAITYAVAGTAGPAAVAGLAAAVSPAAGLWGVGALVATLDARNEHAPPGRRGEVFAAMAGWKIAAASAGSALTGVAVGLGPRPVVIIGGGVTLLCVAIAACDRPA